MAKSKLKLNEAKMAEHGWKKVMEPLYGAEWFAAKAKECPEECRLGDPGERYVEHWLRGTLLEEWPSVCKHLYDRWRSDFFKGRQ